ncbi:hypothetical protein BGZ49_002348 [Haplosporangium sp. Z 27]|nr:hypothetical protein BGZ49_002348 [Haplosporangium sp. Z 27]
MTTTTPIHLLPPKGIKTSIPMGVAKYSNIKYFVDHPVQDWLPESYLRNSYTDLEAFFEGLETLSNARGLDNNIRMFCLKLHQYYQSTPEGQRHSQLLVLEQRRRQEQAKFNAACEGSIFRDGAKREGDADTKDSKRKQPSRNVKDHKQLADWASSPESLEADSNSMTSLETPLLAPTQDHRLQSTQSEEHVEELFIRDLPPEYPEYQRKSSMNYVMDMENPPPGLPVKIQVAIKEETSFPSLVSHKKRWLYAQSFSLLRFIVQLPHYEFPITVKARHQTPKLGISLKTWTFKVVSINAVNSHRYLPCDEINEDTFAHSALDVLVWEIFPVSNPSKVQVIVGQPPNR